MKDVAVIGAGPAGLVALKELMAAGFQPTGFEKQSSIGGKWSYDNPGNTGIWDDLCLNLSRRFMEYSDFPWPDDIRDHNKKPDYAGLFPHRDEFMDYLTAYARHFDLTSLINFNTEIISIEKSGGGKGPGWTVTTRPVGGTETTSTQFDGVVICCGYQAKRHHPLAETSLKDYTGTLIHGDQVKSLDNFQGKSVLVIGSCISGPEISCGLANRGNCKEVWSSVRKVNYQIQKVSPVADRSWDDLMLIRFPAWLGRIAPDKVMLSGLLSTVKENFPSQLEKSDNCFDGPNDSLDYLTASENLVDVVKAGKVKVVPTIQSSNGNIVTFVDGTQKEFDVVICCTGYRTEYSFFSDEMKEEILYEAATGHTNPYTYHNCLVPGVDGLAFSGHSNIIGPVTPVTEMECRLIAAVWSGKVSLPRSKITKVADHEKRRRQSNKFNAHKVAIVTMEEIGDDLGVTPSLLRALWEPSKYLFKPCYPVQYRTNPAIDGPEVAKQSKERFEYYLANPQVATWTSPTGFLSKDDNSSDQ